MTTSTRSALRLLGARPSSARSAAKRPASRPDGVADPSAYGIHTRSGSAPCGPGAGRFSRRTHYSDGLLVAALALGLVASCAYTRSVFTPRVWDRNAGVGPLAVYGSDPSAPGPRIFAELQREPSLAEFLAREGEPDTVEVVGERFEPKRIVLTYMRRAAAPARRIVLEPGDGGFVPQPAELMATPSPGPSPGRTPRRRRTPRPEAPAASGPAPALTPAPADAAAPARPPTARERLECPIDPDQPGCRALCVPGATHEWCR